MDKSEVNARAQPEGVEVPPWTEKYCDRCGCRFQFTRTEPRADPGEYVCHECAAYERGAKEGEAELTRVKAELTRVKAELTYVRRECAAYERGAKEGETATGWRARREDRLRALCFEDPTNDERRERLARNAALKDWPGRGQGQSSILRALLVKALAELDK